MNRTIQNGARLLDIVRIVPVKGLTAAAMANFKSAWLTAAATPAYKTAPAGAAVGAEALAAVNTPEWDAMNVRRAELIRKDLDEGLTPAERHEYERLQRMSLAAAVKAFPRPKPDFEELARLREELRAASAPVTE